MIREDYGYLQHLPKALISPNTNTVHLFSLQNSRHFYPLTLSFRKFEKYGVLILKKS